VRVGKLVAFAAVICSLVYGSVAWAELQLEVVARHPVTREELARGLAVSVNILMGTSVDFRLTARDEPDCALWYMTQYFTRPGGVEEYQGSIPLGPLGNCLYTLPNGSLFAEVEGTYVYRFEFGVVRPTPEGSELVISNATLTATVVESMREPIAVIAPVGPVTPGQPVTLDGTGSFHPDAPFGDTIVSYEWLVLYFAATAPVEVLRTSEGPLVSFVPSEPGQYRVFLTVTDQQGLQGTALADTFTSNNPPVAVIAPIGSVHPGVPVVLDGTGSFDPDVITGDSIISYEWQINSPEAGGNAAGALTSFVFPAHGVYDVTLRVIDTHGASGVMTLPISTFNAPPSADAGIDISVTHSTSMVLPCYTPPCDVPQGNRSSDPDGDSLTYVWEQQDLVTLTWQVVSDRPIITPPVDASTKYRLTVSDPFGAANSDEVVISFNANLPPVANAGPNQSGFFIGDAIHLDGSLSSDPEGAPLSYQWSLVSYPEQDPAPRITFLKGDPSSAFLHVNAEGIYVVALIVNDGQLDSPPSTATFFVAGVDDEIVVRLQELINFLNGLPNSEFGGSGQKGKLTNKINTVILEVQQGNFPTAYDLLLSTVLVRFDGCARAGAADSTDWLKFCPAQTGAYNITKEVRILLVDLMDGEDDIMILELDIKPGTVGNIVNPIKDTGLPVAILIR
jgi:hypothetical protein